MAAEASKRKGVQGSGLTPEPHKLRTDDNDGESSELEEEPPKWAQGLVKKMTKMMKKLDKVTERVDLAADAATEARQQAYEAKEAVATLEGEMGQVKSDIAELKGPGLKGAIKEVLKDEWPSLGGPAGAAKGLGKGVGKSAKVLEKRLRTLRFSNFDLDTKDVDIKQAIDTKLNE
eukprot:9204285-Karenia_brevis.AAC.1